VAGNLQLISQAVDKEEEPDKWTYL